MSEYGTDLTVDDVRRAEAVTIPCAHCSGVSRDRFASAPRTLNEPVGCSVSSFKEPTSGVGGR